MGHKANQHFSVHNNVKLASLDEERCRYAFVDSREHSADRILMGSLIPTRFEKVEDATGCDGFEVRVCSFKERYESWFLCCMSDLEWVLQVDGNYIGAWQLKGKDGVFYDQNQLCDVEAYHCAKAFIPDRAKTYGLEGWFFDVQTIHLYECYHPDHPMTRRESVGYKKRILGLAEELGLFCGTENGKWVVLKGFDFVNE